MALSFNNEYYGGALALICVIAMVIVLLDNSDDDDMNDDIDEAVQMMMDDSSEDSDNECDGCDECDPALGRHGGSRPGRQANVDRNRELYAKLLVADYWGTPTQSPLYSGEDFRRRFRMPRELFDRIVADIVRHDPWFKQKRDCTGKLGLTSLQKICCAVRMIATGNSGDDMDDRYRLAESTAIKSMKRFCNCIVEIYGADALRSPNVDDMRDLLAESTDSRFPGKLGSVDCMHIVWKNCPTAWAGMYTGKEGQPTIVLEAIADHRRRFWHLYFGLPGSLNDINVYDRSPIHERTLSGESPRVTYEVNGNVYTIPYWLSDGIYPTHHCLIQAIKQPTNEKQKLFTTLQESIRKEVECAFGILQAKFQIVARPLRLWKRADIHRVVKACVVLHNLIIDWEIDQDGYSQYANDPFVRTYTVNERSAAERNNISTTERVRRLQELKDQSKHNQLRDDLIEHIWNTQHQ